MSDKLKNQDKAPFFVGSESALKALAFWLKQRVYDDFTVGSRTKKNQPIINLIKKVSEPEANSEWVSGIIIDDDKFIKSTIEIVQSNRRAEA